MKTLILSLLLASLAMAQAPGTVDVSATINATAGTLTCVGTAFVAANTSTMHIKCSDGAVVLIDNDYTVRAPGSTLYGVGRGSDTISWLLSKGNPIPDQWQVTATTIGGSKTGSGNF